MPRANFSVLRYFSPYKMWRATLPTTLLLLASCQTGGPRTFSAWRLQAVYEMPRLTAITAVSRRVVYHQREMGLFFWNFPDQDPELISSDGHAPALALSPDGQAAVAYLQDDGTPDLAIRVNGIWEDPTPQGGIGPAVQASSLRLSFSVTSSPEPALFLSFLDVAQDEPLLKTAYCALSGCEPARALFQEEARAVDHVVFQGRDQPVYLFYITPPPVSELRVIQCADLRCTTATAPVALFPVLLDDDDEPFLSVAGHFVADQAGQAVLQQIGILLYSAGQWMLHICPVFQASSCLAATDWRTHTLGPTSWPAGALLFLQDGRPLVAGFTTREELNFWYPHGNQWVQEAVAALPAAGPVRLTLFGGSLHLFAADLTAGRLLYFTRPLP